MNIIKKMKKNITIFTVIPLLIIINLVYVYQFDTNLNDYTIPNSSFKSDEVINIAEVGTIEQTYECEKEDLYGFSLWFATYLDRQNEGILKVEFLDDRTKEIIKYWEEDMSLFKDNQRKDFVFDNELLDCKNRLYTIRISVDKEVDLSKSVAVYIVNSNIFKNGKLVFDDSYISSKSLNVLEFNAPLNAKYKLIVRNIAITAILLINILVLTVIFLCKDVSKRYAITIFIIGLFYLIVFPLGEAPDEAFNFLRSYEISRGHLISSKDNGGGQYLPEKLEEINYGQNYFSEINLILNKNHSENEKFFFFAGASLYSPVQYIPHALGIFIAEIFFDNPQIIGYACRLFNLLTCCIISYYATKIYPFSKNAIFMIFMLPMTMQGVSLVSADGLIIASIFAFLSFVFNMNLNKKIMNKSDIIIALILGLIISSCKIVYFPFLVLALFIRPYNFKDKRMYIIFMILFYSLSILLNISWLGISSGFLKLVDGNSNPNEQISFIILHPFNYLNIFIRTLITDTKFYIDTMLGQQIGTSLIPLNIMLLRVYGIIIIIIAVLDSNTGIKVSNILKISCIVVFLSITSLILTALYIQWTPVGKNLVVGVHGRYFLPLLPLLSICLNVKRKFVDIKNLQIIVLSLGIFISNMTLIHVLYYYIMPL